MKKSYLFSIITIVILFLLVLTNPDSVVHKAKVKESILKDTELLTDIDNQSGWEILGTTLGLSLVDKLIDTAIQVDNYVLFSLTRATWDDEDKIIGIGIIGNIFFLKDIDEKSLKTEGSKRNFKKENSDVKGLAKKKIEQELERGIEQKFFSTKSDKDVNGSKSLPTKLIKKIRGKGSKETDTIQLPSGDIKVEFDVFCDYDEYCKVSLLSANTNQLMGKTSFFTDWKESYSDHETLEYFNVRGLNNGNYYFEVEAPENAGWSIRIYQ